MVGVCPDFRSDAVIRDHGHGPLGKDEVHMDATWPLSPHAATFPTWAVSRHTTFYLPQNLNWLCPLSAPQLLRP